MNEFEKKSLPHSFVQHISLYKDPDRRKPEMYK